MTARTTLRTTWKRPFAGAAWSGTLQANAKRPNCLNAMRLGFAFLVVAAHSWSLTGTRPTGPFLLGHTEIGVFGLYGFFALSGYLVTGSRIGNSTWHYLANRALRIVPGFWTCLVVTAFVIAPASLLLVGDSLGGFSWHSASHYVLGSLDLKAPGSIAGTLEHNPGNAWDGSLWTVRFEVFCYLILAALALPGVRRGRWLVVVLTLGDMLLFLSHQQNHIFGAHPDVRLLAHFWPLFGAGAILRLWADRIPSSGRIAGVCAVLLVAQLIVMNDPAPAMAFPLAYLCVWVGQRFAGPELTRRHDISYGVYIYAYPVQQLLIAVHADRWGALVFLLLCSPLICLFGVASWFVVERPALRLKRGLPRSRLPSHG